VLRDEILQQPSVLGDFLNKELDHIRNITAEFRQRDIQYMVIAARGTSDNAARYGKYLLGSRIGLQVALATPSLYTLYDHPPRLKGAIVVGISQSGESEDVVSVLAEARRQTVPTLAITNSPNSPLAAKADYIIETHAGEECSVAATKTYTSQLTALAALATCWTDSEEMFSELETIPEVMQHTLGLEPIIKGAAPSFRQAEHIVVIGRGYNYATAFEIALKLKETCYIAAEPYSPADFLHGPVALIEAGYPAIILAPSGAAYSNLIDFTKKLSNLKASILMVSDSSEALDLAEVQLKIQSSLPEWITPMAMVVPGQLLAFHLAHARGLDPDKPRGLEKVTITR
jgi:glucosamine--fructose-6-phosphate aminotransferase (isomerizing)